MTKEEAKAFAERVIDLGFKDETQEFCEFILKLLEQEPCEDAISREKVLDEINRVGVEGFETYNDYSQLYDFVDTLPPVTPQPKIGHCKECKWWKDSDGVYRRGIGAESQCPINCKKVYEGNGYCFLFEKKESEEDE